MTTPAQLADTVRATVHYAGSQGYPRDAVDETFAALAALVELAEESDNYYPSQEYLFRVEAERDAAVADNQTLKVLGDKWVDRAADAEARAANLEAALEDISSGDWQRYPERESHGCTSVAEYAAAALLVSAGRDEQETNR